jgi:hypothetical protein
MTIALPALSLPLARRPARRAPPRDHAETASLFQHPLFAATLSRLGAAPETVDTPDGPVLLTLRRLGPLRLAAALRAPPLSEAALRVLRRHGLRLCEPEGEGGLRAAGFRQVMTPAHVAELDLTGSLADRRARMERKWRGHLNRAGRAGLMLRDLAFQGAAADWLIDREGAMRAARRYHALHPDFARAWAATAPEAARLFVADLDGSPVAAMLMLRHGRRATYHLGWSGPEGRAVSAHHLLLTHAAGWLADRGVTTLDLGTVDSSGNPGLAAFKTGSGARLRPLGGSWLAIPGL